MKLLFVFGTRPEAIKMAPVIRAAMNIPAFDVHVCVTGQHREMLDQVLEFFRIRPGYDLQAMRHGQHLGTLTARILEDLSPILQADRPDLVLVQGDTISAFAATLACFFERIPVAHIEAGLRTHDLASPFPEEALRQMISRLATLHFAPTKANVASLLKEGISPRTVFLTGNPGIDAVLWTRERIRDSRANPLAGYLDAAALQQIERAPHLILVTGHRRENLGSGLGEVCEALAKVASEHSEAAIVFPVHPNPAVRDTVYAALQGKPNIFLLPPVDYPTFVYLMDRSSLILSDSGGIQEEAPALGRPVLLTRDNTERPEAVESGFVQIVGRNADTIVTAVNQTLEALERDSFSFSSAMPFGDGCASERIMDIIERQTSFDHRPTASLQALIAAVGTAYNSLRVEPVTLQ